GSSSALTIAWAKGRPGQSTMQYEIMGSAYGGGMGHDGASATATHLSNLHITPIEILESEFPCRITRFELVPDSGGAGEWRGGLSLLREYELLENATVIRRYDKSRFPPRGIAGGKAGRGARFVIRLATAQEYETPSSGRYEMQAGERFLLQSAGGGGCGDPRRRGRAALARDMAEGYVSPDAAKKDYGGEGGPPSSLEAPERGGERMGLSSRPRPPGVVNAPLRPGVTEEVVRLLPEGIGLIPLFLNIRRGTEDEFATMMPAYEELVAVLAECGCDLIHPHGAPPFMVQGRKREAEIIKAWEKK